MSSLRVLLFCSLVAGLACVPLSATTTPRHTVTHRASSHSSRHLSSARARRSSHKIHGQQAIDPERVTQIQQALVKEHYLTADPNGQWDAATLAAMQKYQADHGWQTKLMPDSRALKALGLGPDYSGAINAKDVAANGTASAPGTTSTVQAAGFAAASGVNR